MIGLSYASHKNVTTGLGEPLRKTLSAHLGHTQNLVEENMRVVRVLIHRVDFPVVSDSFYIIVRLGSARVRVFLGGAYVRCRTTTATGRRGATCLRR